MPKEQFFKVPKEPLKYKERKMDAIDLFFFIFAAIATVLFQMWFFKSSVETFEDKQNWGNLSEDDKNISEEISEVENNVNEDKLEKLDEEFEKKNKTYLNYQPK